MLSELRQTSSRRGDGVPPVRALHHQLGSMQLASLQASALRLAGLATFEALQVSIPAGPIPAACARHQDHPSKVLSFAGQHRLERWFEPSVCLRTRGGSYLDI